MMNPFRVRDSTESTQVIFCLMGFVIITSFWLGPPKWHSSGSVMLLESHGHGAIVAAISAVIASTMLIVARVLGQPPLLTRLALAIGSGTYAIVGLVFLWACRPGGESTGGLLAPFWMLATAWAHYNAAVDLPRATRAKVG